MGIGALRRHHKPATQGAAAVTAAAPGKRAPKSAWEAFALSLGLASDGTKDELIALVDEHIASLAAAEAAAGPAEPVVEPAIVETVDGAPVPTDENGVPVLTASDAPVADDAVVLDAVIESDDSN